MPIRSAHEFGVWRQVSETKNINKRGEPSLKPMVPKKLWKNILEQLDQEVSEKDRHAWLRTLSADSKGGALVLKAPNSYVKSGVESKWLERIAELACAYQGDRVAVRIEVESISGSAALSHSGHSRTAPVPGAAGKKLQFGFSELNPDFTFGQHIVGESNKLARFAAEAASKDPGQREYNPLFIYGTVGIGKTHLMQAAGHALVAKNPNAKVGLVNAQNFVQHIIKAMMNRNNDVAERMKRAYRELDALLIDDIHLFSGRESSQSEFLQTFNILLEGGKQIIVTSDKFAREITQVEDRIKSRLSQGLTVRIRRPELETRIAILETKAQLRHMSLKPDVLRYLAENITASVRELEGALNKLAASYRLTGKNITVGFAKDLLSDYLEFDSRPITIDSIQKTVSHFYGIRRSDMLSGSRRADLVLARHVAMSLAREFTSQSLPDIGKEFGGKNHGTVLHAQKRVTERMEKDPRFRDEFNSLRDQFRQ